MATIQLPNLLETQEIEGGDTFLVRKDASNSDSKIKFTSLCNNIGNSSILGYKATVKTEIQNQQIVLSLSTVNNAPIPYEITFSNNTQLLIPVFPNNTLIFFTFPKEHKGKINIEILNQNYSITNTNDTLFFSCKSGDYFVIQYNKSTNKFIKINNLNNNFFTNIYEVKEIYGNSDGNSIIKLSSRFGLPLQEHSVGMEIIFTPDRNLFTNKILIAIDDLEFLMDGQRAIYPMRELRFIDLDKTTTLIKGSEVRAVFDGTRFIIGRQDYPQLLPKFSSTVNYDNNYFLDFYNYYYSSFQTNYNIYSFYVDKNDTNANYDNLADAINDIEQMFGRQKENIRIRLQVGSIALFESLIIDRDLSYIFIEPKNQSNQHIIIDCNNLTTTFLIIKNGVFFSVAKDTVFYLKSTRVDQGTDERPSGCNLFHIHNNAHNIFENFTILLGEFSSNRTIFALFNIVYSGGGVSIKNVSVRNDTTYENKENYTYAIVAGFFTSNLYINNSTFYNRKADKGYGLFIGGINWINGTLTYTSFKHNIYIEKSDFRINASAQDNQKDIYFKTDLSEVKGFTTLNTIQTRGGTNIEKPTEISGNSWYKIIPSLCFYSTHYE